MDNYLFEELPFETVIPHERIQRLDNFWQQPAFYDKMLPTHGKSFCREELPMSIAGAIIGKDAIALVTDSRGLEGKPTGEFRVIDTIKKCWRISKYCGIACTGKVGYAQLLVESFRDNAEAKKMNLEEIYITQLVRSFSRFAHNDFAQYADNSALGKAVIENYSFTIEFILAGYTKSKEPKIAIVCHSVQRPGFIPEFINQPYKFSGMYIVSYHLLLKIEPLLANLEVKKLEYLTTILLLETYASDMQVGGPIQLVIIPKHGKAYEAKKTELAEAKKYVKKNMKNLDKKLIETLRHNGQE